MTSGISRRLAMGGRIDRAKPLGFTFDGHALSGFEGDTLASALLGAGVRLIGRSFKYHRPRGLISAGAEEPNGLFTLGQGARLEPNIPGTMTDLVEGLVARSQNAWPSVEFDLMAVNGLAAPFLQAGFYYKTFMGPTRHSWMFYERFIRRAAGLGRGTHEPDPDRYETRNAFADVLVVGAGPAGLSAALVAARGGCRVVLVDQDREPGGSLLSETDEQTQAWRRAVVNEIGHSQRDDPDARDSARAI
jgi:sarcosine oxidase subunit alpha